MSGSHRAGGSAGEPGSASEPGGPGGTPSAPPAPASAVSAASVTRARELAHALANALMPVVGYADLLALHPAVRRDPALAGQVTEMARAAEQCADLLAELHRALRPQDPEPGS